VVVNTNIRVNETARRLVRNMVREGKRKSLSEMWWALEFFVALMCGERGEVY
jgi:hypothetical protein